MPSDTTIGLKEGAVELAPHRTGWFNLFEQQRARLATQLDGIALDIQHVGSTAVPGLLAKPILDIAVAVASPDDIERCRQPLLAINYLNGGDAGDSGGFIYLKESEPGVRWIHLHIVTIDDPQFRNYLFFRDTLRSDSSLLRQYAHLKKYLRDRFPNDRESYIVGKHDFICEVISRGS